MWKKGWVPSPSGPRQTHRRGRRRGALGATAAAAAGGVSLCLDGGSSDLFVKLIT
jgi:hypothetical protein